MTTQEGDDDLLTTREVIALLHVSRPTLYRMMDEGAIAPVPYNTALKRPLRHYFRRADVERLLREGRRRP
jgi:predicted DNA-binding transcriptional regulator AlpA